MLAGDAAVLDARPHRVEDRQRHARESTENGAVAAIVSVIIASWLPRTWCMRAPSRVYASRNGLVFLFGAAVGEIALHQDRVGIERSHLGDRARVHHVRVRLGAGLGAQDRAELLGRAEPAAFDFAEVHVVDRGERREQLSRRAGERREAPGSRSVGSTPSTRSGYAVSGSRPVMRAEWYGPFVVISCSPTAVVTVSSSSVRKVTTISSGPTVNSSASWITPSEYASPGADP